MDKNFSVPPEMRALAEKSLDQAKQAFDGFMAATRQAVATVESHAANARSGAQDVNALALRFAEHNIETSFEFAQKLARAKTVQEMMSLHADYVKQQMAALNDQAKDLGQRAAEMAAKK
jgi:phasin